MEAWQRVPAELAQAHPLYGMRGWLRIPSIGFVLVLLGSVLMLIQGASLPTRWGAWDMLGAVFVLGIPVAALLWFRRWQHFRPAFLGYALLSGAYELADVAQAAPRAVDPGGEVALVVIGLMLDGAFLLAMQRSQRFRVTFEHRMRAPNG